jgi:hypothetical protein
MYSIYFLTLALIEGIETPISRGRLRKTALELHKLAWSQRDMPHQTCTRIDPVSSIQNRNKLPDYCANQEA